MFEKLKHIKIISRIKNINHISLLNKVWDEYKTEIESHTDLFIAFVEKTVELNHYPNDSNFFNAFKKNISYINNELLSKIVESSRLTNILLNDRVYPSLTKELRLKCLNYYGNWGYDFNFDNLILIEDIIDASKNNGNLKPLLKKRLTTLSDEELIKYINADEQIVFEISSEKLYSLIGKLVLSTDILCELFDIDNNILKYVSSNHSLLLQIIRKYPNKINFILSNIDINNFIELYNLDKAYFDSIFLHNPDFFGDNITLQNYILINNKDIIKKQLSGFFISDGKKRNNFGDDFFLDNLAFEDILSSFGSKKFIEFLKYYPLFGASEKPFGAGNSNCSAYVERQMYNNKHYNLNKNISLDDMCEMLELDINYLFNIYNFRQTGNIDFATLKQNILNVLSKMMMKQGLEEKYELLLPSVDKIFENINEDKVLTNANGGNAGFQSFKIKKYELIKLLFNSDVISHNSIQDINDYIDSCYNNSNDCQEKFYKIFGKAYGSKALEIIKSRPGLDIFTINSLEIFKSSIIDNFSEGFIHDLLSYNIKGFSNFLIISKNSEELSLFIDYYDCLSKIYGENVMTMEKSFLNFYYYKDLIKSIQNIDLSEEEQQNLVAVLSGNLNYHNINNYEDLKNYNRIANQELLELLRECKNINEYKNVLCNDLFGIDYSIIETSYKFVIDNISTSYYTKDFISALSESEKNIMDFLKFICSYEITLDNLQTFINNVINSKNIRNSTSCISLLNKIRVREIEEINKTLLNEQALDEFVKNEHLIKNEFDGVPIYCYTHGKDGECLKRTLIARLLGHDTMLALNEMSTLEPDNGVSTISTWYGHRLEFGRISFAQIPLDTQIVASSPNDGMTSKLAKSVHAKGLKEGMSYMKYGIHNDSVNSNAEISFYRRHRDHKNITNANHGGIIIPDCFTSISMENIEYAKTNGGIIICSYEEYDNFVKQYNNDKGGKKL